MKKLFVIAPIIMLILRFNTAHADRTVWYVHPDSVLNTVQAGLDSCADNDIVLVGPGTYFECLIWPNTQGIHLISECGPEMTIIDGDSSGVYGTVIYCTSCVDTTTIIRGFTIQNGHDLIGGGILFFAGSPKIIGNNIVNNFLWYGCSGGGGISIYEGSPVILDNYIADNAAHSGGGIFCGSQDSTSIATIIGNTLVNNCAYGWGRPGTGSAIFCYQTMALLKHNNIYGHANGNCDCCISCWCAIIESCMIYDNPGPYAYSGYCISCDGNSEIHHCDIFGNGRAISGGDPSNFINAEYNWWGDPTGPYHPDSNPVGLGDTVSDYVDFNPWLYWPGVEEHPSVKHIANHNTISASIFAGPLQLPEGKRCKILDILGRVIMPDEIKPGIYFLEIDGRVVQKVIKIR